MALENQPFFTAPELPKMGKKTVSSSVFSNVESNVKKPTLRKSTFSFTRPKQVKPEALAQNIVQPKEESVSNVLIETNRILVEIQKQLALDFANRIAERKQGLALSRKSLLKQRAVRKESFVERGAGVAKTVANQFKGVIAPAKSIFDKLIDFVTILGTGILINNAWEWLSKKENRDKLIKVLKFLADNWKWLVGIWIGGKLLKPIGLMIKAIGALRKVISFLRGKRRPPDGGPKGGGPGPKGSGGGPSGGDPCAGFRKCLDNMSTQDVENLAKKIIATKTFSPLLGQPTPVVQPPKPKPKTKEPPLLPIFQPSETQPIKEPEKPTADQPWYDTPVVKTLGYGALGLGLGALTIGAAISPFEGPAGEMTAGTATLGAFGRAGQAFRTLSGGARTIPKTTAPGGTTLSRSELAKNLLRDKNLNILRGQELASQISKRAAELVKITGRNKSNLREIYNNPNSPLLDRMAARELLRKLGENVPKLMPEMGGVSSPLTSAVRFPFSSGGTVGGRGSGSVDSVPAMLAPGEEVIKASSAGLFRPLLKDINDNAGKMFMSFEDGIKRQERNNIEQEQTSSRFNTLLADFNKQLEELKNKKQQEKLKDIVGGGSRPPASYLEEMTSTQKYLESVKPKTNDVNISTNLEVSQKNVPVTIQTYSRKSKSGSKPTIINMPMPAIDLSKNQAPIPPQSPNSSSDSSPEISIEPYDSGNPYIFEAFENYGIF